MPSQRDIRRRITASRNIRQITRAMQFVAASKLRRAQESTLAARPYSELIDEILADLAAVLVGDEHPLLSRREEGKRLIVLVTSDRGLAGASQHQRRPLRGQGDRRAPGRAGGGHASAARAATPCAAPACRSWPTSPASATGPPSTTSCRWLASSPTSTRRHLQPGRRHLHAVRLDAGPAGGHGPAAADQAEHGHPAASRARSSSSSRRRRRSCSELLPRYLGTRLYQTALESSASFFSSQMVAMKNATENADELIDDLTLSYNKARQANITRELIEIASGARALGEIQEARHDDGDRRHSQAAPPTMATAAQVATGRVIQITGPVVDIEFPAGQLPGIYNAVEVARGDGVQDRLRGPAAPGQQLGPQRGHDHDGRPGPRRRRGGHRAARSPCRSAR